MHVIDIYSGSLILQKFIPMFRNASLGKKIENRRSIEFYLSGSWRLMFNVLQFDGLKFVA